MLTDTHPPSKEYLLQVSEESLMSLQHELDAVERSCLAMLAEEAATKAKMKKLFRDLTPEGEELPDDAMREDGGAARMDEIEAHKLHDGRPLAVGDVKGWIELRELERKREDVSVAYTELVQEREKKAWAVWSMKGDVSTLHSYNKSHCIQGLSSLTSEVDRVLENRDCGRKGSSNGSSGAERHS